MNVDWIIEYENGELSHAEVVAGFQEMINSGEVWRLQGSYGRVARQLIEDGFCTLPE